MARIDIIGIRDQLHDISKMNYYFRRIDGYASLNLMGNRISRFSDVPMLMSKNSIYVPHKLKFYRRDNYNTLYSKNLTNVIGYKVIYIGPNYNITSTRDNKNIIIWNMDKGVKYKVLNEKFLCPSIENDYFYVYKGTAISKCKLTGNSYEITDTGFSIDTALQFDTQPLYLYNGLIKKDGKMYVLNDNKEFKLIKTVNLTNGIYLPLFGDMYCVFVTKSKLALCWTSEYILKNSLTLEYINIENSYAINEDANVAILARGLFLIKIGGKMTYHILNEGTKAIQRLREDLRKFSRLSFSQPVMEYSDITNEAPGFDYNDSFIKTAIKFDDLMLNLKTLVQDDDIYLSDAQHASYDKTREKLRQLRESVKKTLAEYNQFAPELSKTLGLIKVGLTNVFSK